MFSAELSAKTCHVDPEIFAKGALAMYGSPQPEKTLSLAVSDSSDHKLQFGQGGAFEGINPFTAKSPAPFILRGYLYDSMMYRSPAEPFTLYPQIVRMIDMPEDRNYVTFQVTEGAKFNDGSDITAQDIKFTFQLLKERGVIITALPIRK